MRVSTTLAAILGTLAVLAPLSSAVDTVAGDSVALYDAELDARDTGSCGASSSRKHHKKSKKKHSNTKQQVKAQVNALNVPQGNKSAARPAHFYYTTRQAAQPSTKAATSTRAAASTTSTTAAPASTTTSSSTGSTLTSFEQTMLNIHNTDRTAHSASPLTWSTTLASAAASWAAGCKWQHTPNNPYGQNIAAGTSPTFGATDSANMWYDEYKLYDYNNPGYSSATGHFTQMVWKSSQRLGCAIQQCTAQQMGLGSSGNAQFVVCNYDPPGNYQGQFQANVLPN